MPTSPLLLIGNGEPVSPRLLRKLAAQADYVLAADGGADKALQARITPDAIMGDLDSVSSRTRQHFLSRIVHVPTQENTDLEKALLWACRHRFTNVTLAGFLGGRWDFSIGNLLVLARYAHKLDMTLVTDTWEIYPLVRGRRFAGRAGQRVSILPLTRCSGVSVTGLKYPLKNASLMPGTTRTLSNQTTATHFSIRFSRGKMLVCVEK